MDDSEGKNEIRFPLEVRNPHPITAPYTSVNSPEKPGPACPAPEAFQHLGLDVHCHDPSFRAYEPRKLESEIPHAWTWLENDHSLVDVRADNRMRIIEEPPDRA